MRRPQAEPGVGLERLRARVRGRCLVNAVPSLPRRPWNREAARRWIDDQVANLTPRRRSALTPARITRASENEGDFVLLARYRLGFARAVAHEIADRLRAPNVPLAGVTAPALAMAAPEPADSDEVVPPPPGDHAGRGARSPEARDGAEARPPRLDLPGDRADVALVADLAGAGRSDRARRAASAPAPEGIGRAGAR